MKKQKKPILKQYTNDTFPVTLWVICGDNKDAVEKILNKKFEHREDPSLSFKLSNNYTFAITWENVWDPKSTYRGVVVWIPNTIDGWEAAHESIHVLHQFMLDTGLEWNSYESAGNEHIAYLVEWITKCIMQTAKSKK